MSTIPISSYRPDCQVITLKKEFAAFTDPDNLRGIIGPDEVGYIFHEWIHYLHNVSTIHGLTAFVNFAHLWSAFRNTIGDDGLSAGSTVLNDKQALDIRQKVMIMTAARRCHRNPLPPDVKLQEIQFISAKISEELIEETSFNYSIITCQIMLPQRDGDRILHEIKVGANEILESVAFMLEEKLTRKLGSITKSAPVTPYLLVQGIASLVAPRISDDSVIFCALASLQESDPPSILLDRLKAAQAAMERDEDPLLYLKEMQQKMLLDVQQWVEDRLREVEDTFPNDEPMARAVKSTTNTIRQNFGYRRSSPFLEFELLDRISTNPSSLTEIIETYGACAIIQERAGLPDAINRDLMFDFVLKGGHDDLLSFGWRMLHAAFHFVGLHFTKDSVTATEKLRQGSRTKCPFYTACGYSFRQHKPNECETRPWLSTRTEMNELCWYGRAVFVLAPPNIKVNE